MTFSFVYNWFTFSGLPGVETLDENIVNPIDKHVCGLSGRGFFHPLQPPVGVLPLQGAHPGIGRHRPSLSAHPQIRCSLGAQWCLGPHGQF